MLYRVLRTVLLDRTLCCTEYLENGAAGQYFVLYRVLRMVLLDSVLYRVLRTVLLDRTLCCTECLERCCWTRFCATQILELISQFYFYHVIEAKTFWSEVPHATTQLCPFDCTLPLHCVSVNQNRCRSVGSDWST